MRTEAGALHEYSSEDPGRLEESALLILCRVVIPLLRDLLAEEGGVHEELRARCTRAFQLLSALKRARQAELDELLAQAASQGPSREEVSSR